MTNISLFSLYASRWEATPNRTYGYFRIEVLAIFASILLTWALNVWIVCEAIRRLCHQNREIKGPLMFGVACFGVIVNSVMVFLLGHGHHGHSHDHGHDHHTEEDTEAEGETMNINVLGAYLHVIGDLLQNVGVMISVGLIWWKPKLKIIDLICTFIFSVLALVRTLSTTRKLLDILMETAPREIDPSRLSAGLCDMDEVTAVHELHIWSITVGKVSLSCHVRIKPDADTDATLDKVIEYIKREHKINHVTIQVEREQNP
ncbi:PREDICTED: metal tolerance protein A2-like [Camelina sativa]|uniref:Metal tolerance protein A2-like n=1 Tax=Camelina sativa TaxID=90675 RepID=A0ABM0VYJ1_CAMSA|nr:PREDICTED: metal tolerance protein A2-like [Camelina sativa]